MDLGTQIRRETFEVSKHAHPVARTDYIASLPTRRSGPSALTHNRDTAQVVTVTVSSAYHFEPAATSFADFKDDAAANMMKRMLCLYFQAVDTYRVEREQEVEDGDGSSGTEVVVETLPTFINKYRDGETITIQARRVFVEELKALNDPEVRVGWRFYFVLYDNSTGWHELICQCLRDNESRGMKRRIKPEEFDANPQWAVKSRDQLAVLYAFYAGNAVESVSTFRRALHEDYSNPSNPACPITALSFDRSVESFDRFESNAELGSLSMIDVNEPPMIEQCMRGNYFQVTQSGAALTFPMPESVWEIPHNFWSFSALNGSLLPGYESSYEVELANQMRQCRIGVSGDMGSITHDIAGQFLALQDTGRIQEGAEEVSMSIIDVTKDSRGIGNAAFDTSAKVEISKLSPSEQFEMTSCLVRIRNAHAPLVSEFKRCNLTKEEYDVQYNDYRRRAVKTFQKEVFCRDNKRLSEPERAVVNYFLAFLQNRMKLDEAIVPDDFVVPTTDATLTPNANYIKFLMDEAENNGMATFHAADFLIWTGMNDSWRYGTGMHINFALTGKHGTGKSYLMALNMARAVPGVAKNVMHETSKAEMTSGNRNGEEKYLEELPAWMFGNTEGQGAETGDPTLKARLTQAIISVVFFHSDKETGTRQRRVIYSMAMGTLCAGTNEEWYQMPPALRDRFWHITAPKMRREGSAPADRINMGEVNPFDYTSEVSVDRFRFEQCLIALIEMLVTTRCIGIQCNGINMQAFHHISRHHYAELESLGVDVSNVRCRERVLYLARTLTIRFAIYDLFFQPMSRYRMLKTFDLLRFAQEVEKRLVCTEEITNFAFEMASSQFVDPNIEPVISELRKMTHYSSSRTRGSDEDGVLRETSVASTNLDVTNDQSSASVGVANHIEDGTVLSVGVCTAAPMYAQTAKADGTTQPDYNYVECDQDLNGLTSDIAARISQNDVALAIPDIRTVLRTLSKMKILAHERKESNVPNTAREKEFYSVVVIDDFNKKIRILCAYMDEIIKMCGRNVVQEVISGHRHFKQSSYDTVTMIPIRGFPDLLPRRCVRPCTEEEYRTGGAMYLMAINPNIRSREELRQAGLLHHNPTAFRNYMEVFHSPVTEFNRFSPETEVLLQHLMITGNDPNQEFGVFPCGQQARQRIVSYAEKLFTEDFERARAADMAGHEYEREFPTVKDAFIKAQDMEYRGTIRFAAKYPVLQIYTRAIKDRVTIYASQKDVRKRIIKLTNRFYGALKLSGTMDRLEPDDKAKYGKINFDLNPIVHGSIANAAFDQRLKPMQFTDAGLRITASDVANEGVATTRNPDQLLLGSPEDGVEDMEIASPSTRKRRLESTYGGIWSKRPNLLDAQVHRELQYQIQASQEREERRRAAREAVHRTLQPPLPQEPIDEQALFDNYDEIHPGDGPIQDALMPCDMMGNGMSQEEIISPACGVVAL